MPTPTTDDNAWSNVIAPTTIMPTIRGPGARCDRHHRPAAPDHRPHRLPGPTAHRADRPQQQPHPRGERAPAHDQRPPCPSRHRGPGARRGPAQRRQPQRPSRIRRSGSTRACKPRQRLSAASTAPAARRPSEGHTGALSANPRPSARTLTPDHPPTQHHEGATLPQTANPLGLADLHLDIPSTTTRRPVPLGRCVVRHDTLESPSSTRPRRWPPGLQPHGSRPAPPQARVESTAMGLRPQVRQGHHREQDHPRRRGCLWVLSARRLPWLSIRRGLPAGLSHGARQHWPASGPSRAGIDASTLAGRAPRRGQVPDS